MIPFNNLGHCFSGLGEPIVWLDSSDTDSYVVGSPELITNGDFSDETTGWTKGTAPSSTQTIINGALEMYSGAVSDSSNTLSKVDTLVQGYEGRLYQFKVTVTNMTGGVGFIRLDGVYDADNIIAFGEGAYTINFTAYRDFNNIRFIAASSDNGYTIDDVSVKEVLPNAQEVTSIDNKGTLGGDFDLFGSVKFNNNGFESWSSLDYIKYDLLEPFITNNSFTMVTTFDLQNASTGLGYVSRLFSDESNFLNTVYASNQLYIEKRSSNSYDGKFNDIPNFINTTVFSYHATSQLLLMINYTEFGLSLNSIVFNNTDNSIISLLSNFGSSNLGQDNTLYEFRLYDKAISLNQMKKIQTELNNKYI